MQTVKGTNYDSKKGIREFAQLQHCHSHLFTFVRNAAKIVTPASDYTATASTVSKGAMSQSYETNDANDDDDTYRAI